MASRSTDNGSKSFISYNDLETPEKTKAVAIKNLNETNELKEKCLQKLKTLINEHGMACITADDFLLRFLRTKKFNVQRSFHMLKNYARHRIEFHERLLKLGPEIVEKCLHHNILGLLPYRDAEERLIVFYTTGIWNPDICSIEELAMVIVLLMNFAAEKESTQTTGIVFISDTTLVPLSHIPYLMNITKFLLNFTLNGVPARFTRLHSINEPPAVKYPLTLISPLLPKKIKQRMSFHGDKIEDLFQYFSPDILPDNFGGTLGPLNNDHLTKVLIDYLYKMKYEQCYFF